MYLAIWSSSDPFVSLSALKVFTFLWEITQMVL